MKNLSLKFMRLLRQIWACTLLLVMIAALTIWYAGPLLAVADHRLWESPTARLLTISVLFLTWGLTMVFIGSRGPATVTGGEPTEAERKSSQDLARIAEERAELMQRFKDAERVLGTSGLYAKHKRQARCELPWYLVIGPQHSGKTSLLDFSGLDFPLNRTERRLTRDTRGSSSCEWYFTDQAVLLDTTGRYFTQAQQRIDSSAWMSLLSLLRARRRGRSLNGVLVTVPVEELLGTQELRLEQLAATTRERLQELRSQLRVEVPVYLVLTKADAITGFDEFFEQLSREETGQVFGHTFSTDQTGSDVGLLRQTFEALLSRLNSQVLTRIHQERGVRRRGLILDFAQQLGRIGENLCLFAELAFAGNRYQHASRLRGYYLTRAPHAGFDAPHTAVPEGLEALGAGSRLPVLSTGKTRFIRDLLSRVIFAEAELASLDKDLRWRMAWGQRAGVAIAAVVLLTCGALWAGSFSANHDRLEQIRTLAGQWLEGRSALRADDDLLAALPTLNLLLEAGQVFPEPARIAIHERNGLYQGEPANRILAGAYDAELRRQLLPRVARQLEAQMAFSLGNREQLLASLRAYLMLGLREHRDRAWLQDMIATDWSLRFPGQLNVQAQLNEHLRRLLEQPFEHPMDQILVARARKVLRNESLAGVVYRALRDQARGAADYRLTQHIGGQGNLFTGADHPIPGFYTRRGYDQYFLTRGASMVTDILRDNWVLGDSGNLSPAQLRRLLVELEQLYFRDYANHWGDALGRIALQPLESARQGAGQMAELTAANSPLVRLLREIREQTRFTVPAVPEASSTQPVQTPVGARERAGAAISAAVGQAGDALLPALPDAAKKALERRFEDLHRLLDENDEPTAQLAPTLQALNDLQQQFAALGRSEQPELAAFDMARVRMSNPRDALSVLRGAAAQLPQPVGVWFGRLAEDSWVFVLQQAYRHLDQRYQDEVYSFYAQALDKRYPFHAHSASDVALDDFREFFKAQGIADRFFETCLKAFVTGEPGHYRLRAIDGFSIPMSRAWLDQMVNVQVIRKGFFAHSADEPQIQFKLEPYTLDPVVGRAEFRLGDQVIEYRHGPVLPAAFKWPTDVDDGRAALVLDRMEGRAVGIEKNTGPWSLFRLLDLMQTEPLQGRDVLLVKGEVGGLRANYLLGSQRSPNPFDLTALRRFRLPAHL